MTYPKINGLDAFNMTTTALLTALAGVTFSSQAAAAADTPPPEPDNDAVLRVDADAPNGGDGASWATAFNDLNDALETARDQPGVAEIWIAEGDYFPDRGIGDRLASFELVPGVNLYGGFNGTESQRGQRDPDQYESALTGDIGDPTKLDNSIHVAILMGGDVPTTLDGLTIRRGYADGEIDPEDRGAGLFVVDSEALLNDCRFLVCETPRQDHMRGGGIYARRSTMTLTNCDFRRNIAGRGAGFYFEASDFSVRNCEFLENVGTHGGGGQIDGSSGEVTDCEFLNNDGIGSGGGLGMWNALDVTISRCSFVGSYTNQDGGAIVNVDTDTRILDCEFINGRGDFGIGVYNYLGRQHIANCLFQGNEYVTTERYSAGAGIFNRFAHPVVVNCLFLDNAAGGGAGIYHVGGDSTVINCTFVGNVSNTGNTMHSIRGARSVIFNSILWNSGLEILDTTEAVTQVENSIVRGGWPGVGNLDGDPMFVDPVNGDFRLLPASPAIDSGNNNQLSRFELTEDFDGAPRFVDDPGMPDTGRGDGAFIDAGAYEFQGTTTSYVNVRPTPGVAGAQNAMQIGGGTPGKETVFYYAFTPGWTDAPGCPGLEIELQSAVRMGSAIANANGLARIILTVPGQASGRTVFLQAYERDTCMLTNRVKYRFP